MPVAPAGLSSAIRNHTWFEGYIQGSQFKYGIEEWDGVTEFYWPGRIRDSPQIVTVQGH